MPKQKTRARRKLNHYREAPYVPSRYKGAINKRSAFLGAAIGPKNQKEYGNQQKEFYVQKYYRDLEQRKKTNEEKPEDQRTRIEELPKWRVEANAEAFARFQINKEKKHYKAWLRGDLYYNYKGTTYPVTTEDMVKQTRSFKEIIKVENDGRKESGDDSAVSADGESGNSETL